MAAGNRSDPTTVTKVDYRELGLSGTRLFAGLVSEETVPQLQGQAAFTSYRGMWNDATGSAIHKAVELPLRSARWFIEPSTDAKDDVMLADFIHSVLWDFGSQSYDDVLRLALTAMVFGFNASEIVYAPIDIGEFKGKIGWDSLAYRMQSTKWRWEMDWVNSRRQLTGMTQLAPPYFREVFIPRNKLLLWVNDQAGDNFDGVSAFRAAYKDFFIRDRLYRIRAIGLERAYMGVPDITLPQGFSTEEMELAKSIVTTLRGDEGAGVVRPENLILDIKSWALNDTAMESAVQFHNRQMLMSCLAQFLALGSTSVGSFALSSDQSEMFQMAIGAKANYFAQVLNLEPGIPSLIGLNFPNVDRTKMPQLQHGDIGQRSLDTLGRTLMALAAYGFITPDNATEDRLREMLDFPERDSNVSPDALKDLTSEIFPTGAELGRVEPPRAAPVMPLKGPKTGGPPGSTPGAPGAAPVQPQPQQAAQQAAAASGVSAREARRMAENQVHMQEVLARRAWPRPRGRMSEDTRNAAKATERFTEALSDVYDDAMHRRSSKPPKPSEVVARNRRPYVVSAEGSRQAGAPPTIALSKKFRPKLQQALSHGKVKGLR